MHVHIIQIIVLSRQVPKQIQFQQVKSDQYISQMTIDYVHKMLIVKINEIECREMNLEYRHHIIRCLVQCDLQKMRINFELFDRFPVELKIKTLHI